MKQVNFTRMQDGDQQDYDCLSARDIQYSKATADRLLKAMADLDAGLSGYRITRLDHSVQAATRAWRACADTDWLVSACLHDIADIYAPCNHDAYAATIVRPFVREVFARTPYGKGVIAPGVRIALTNPDTAATR